ncbi:MAG: creatininase family protein [Planctomycetaceae bacterium]|nr:creatininase family protein [Planctomycetaceae bacterium]
MNLSEMTWPSVDRLNRDTPVVFPIAALEQHGHHMPVFTDSLLLGEVIRRIQQRPVASRLLFAPLMWLGNSHHHMDMPGTLSASPRLYLDLLKNLAGNFLQHGFRRIAFINGHGGNTTPSQQALFELRQEFRDRRDLLLVSLTYWDSAKPADTLNGLTQTEMGHAGEWETSMMLAIRPELVHGNPEDVSEVPFGRGAAPGYRGWTMPDRSIPGHIGCPADATATKGEALFEVFAEGVTNFLQRTVDWDGQHWDV